MSTLRPRHQVGARILLGLELVVPLERLARGVVEVRRHRDLHLDDAAREALERYHELEPKENPRADLMSRAQG